jgi:Txe/YoeB family toxin of Txe-Axe toxin-antitoxin module
MKSVRIKLSIEALTVFDFVTKRSITSKRDLSMLKAIMRNIEIIKKNPFYGDKLSKKLIPKEYIKNYDADNLYRIELPDFFRMLYTLKDDEIEIIAFVLDIVDHKKYNKKLRYE